MSKTLWTQFWATGRSRKGAWIEIKAMVGHTLLLGCRSREGAWIEMCVLYHEMLGVLCHFYKGTWIEIPNTVGLSVLLMQMTYFD